MNLRFEKRETEISRFANPSVSVIGYGTRTGGSSSLEEMAPPVQLSGPDLVPQPAPSPSR